ncbi:hypothetical protein MKJ04_20720 [Pontibacter sp. E15-1]|nr:hypothetical protein [Pontibacter sp. E15-1]MCJ8167276.1 hypothetical protein [Pontibacter sp. E15-1]
MKVLKNNGDTAERLQEAGEGYKKKGHPGGQPFCNAQAIKPASMDIMR